MLRKIYAVKDTVSGDVHSLTLFSSDAEAVRFFTDCLSDSKYAASPYVVHSSDFVLFFVGDLDLTNCSIVPAEIPLVISSFEDLVDLSSESN